MNYANGILCQSLQNEDKRTSVPLKENIKAPNTALEYWFLMWIQQDDQTVLIQQWSNLKRWREENNSNMVHLKVSALLFTKWCK